MRLVVLVLGLLIAWEANATCIRMPGGSFEDVINSEFRYLICLHNEQNDLFRSQADAMQLLENEIAQKETKIDLLEDKIGRLENRILVLEGADPPLARAPIKRTPEQQREFDESFAAMRRIIESNQPPIKK
ncbi:hypothetical protein [Agrobacterium vitis]|uniref:hypothetical protein n=1 Tax=Agrobacterium vitis TaxID=373 RepID=UPI0012E73F73|nr:hypothetical protein [Agrobacterium vitis]MVA33625.1 hypothetical protein [Agrobacterium vitis]